MVRENNSFWHQTLTIELLIEFIQDANKKDELELEFEIEFFHPNQEIKTINSFGVVHLNKPNEGSILIIENSTNDQYIIFPDNDKINFSKYDISKLDELCFLKVENPESNKWIGKGLKCGQGVDKGFKRMRIADVKGAFIGYTEENADKLNLWDKELTKSTKGGRC